MRTERRAWEISKMDRIHDDGNQIATKVLLDCPLCGVLLFIHGRWMGTDNEAASALNDLMAETSVGAIHYDDGWGNMRWCGTLCYVSGENPLSA